MVQTEPVLDPRQMMELVMTHTRTDKVSGEISLANEEKNPNDDFHLNFFL